MATITLKLEDELFEKVKKISVVYKEDVNNIMKEALKLFLAQREQNNNKVYERLTQFSEYCSDEESAEIIERLNNLAPEDLEIAETETVYLYDRNKNKDRD